MSVSFLSECKEKVLNRIDALLPDTNKIVSAMRYSALADSKCIRAGLIFASGNPARIRFSISLACMAMGDIPFVP